MTDPIEQDFARFGQAQVDRAIFDRLHVGARLVARQSRRRRVILGAAAGILLVGTIGAVTTATPWLDLRRGTAPPTAISSSSETDATNAATPSPTASPTESAALARHVGTYQATGTGGDAAILRGTVRLFGNCFTVEQDGTGGRFLPLFPDDEVAWGEGRLDYDGKTYGDGDTVVLGGGQSGIVEGATVPESCEINSGLTPWTVAQEG